MRLLFKKKKDKNKTPVEILTNLLNVAGSANNRNIFIFLVLHINVLFAFHYKFIACALEKKMDVSFNEAIFN